MTEYLTEHFQRLSWMLFDTLSTSGRSRLHFFQSSRSESDRAMTNMDFPGALPMPQTFEVERFEIRALLPTPGGYKALARALLCARVSFYVANKIYGDWPLDELARPRKRVHRKTTEFGNVTEEFRLFYGYHVVPGLLLEAQVHFELALDMNDAKLSFRPDFLLRAMLHGVLTRPVA